MNELLKKYEGLDRISQTLLQIVAFQHSDARYAQLASHAKLLGLR